MRESETKGKELRDNRKRNKEKAQREKKCGETCDLTGDLGDDTVN